MNYELKYENENESLIQRLFKIRNIDNNIDDFLDPKIKRYRIDPFLLNDMEIWVNRIIQAIKNNEKIMIFGDYDVDGITSSFILFKFVTKYLWYKNISISYPDRLKDGYWLKNNHLDDFKEKKIDLVITVDNWITSIQEAEYAKELWIDLIITDHHKNLEIIPNALAVINPQISPNYEFKWLAGVWVAFKVINAILKKSKFDTKKKNEVFNYFLPIVSIGTVADMVPLIEENRAIVKKWLEIINNKSHKVPSSLKQFLTYFKVEKLDTFNIGFVIWPRINAWWRICSPYDSLNTLLYTGEKQLAYLENINNINNERKKIQENAFKIAEQKIILDKNILIVEDEEFHEGVVGIVSGRITEKYYKPSIILKINKKKWIATGSLRWPDYFSIIDMLKKHDYLLERFWWHKQAGGMTIKLEKLEEFKTEVNNYCDKEITDECLIKIDKIDTILYHREREYNILEQIDQLEPFWEGNPEPIFLIKNIKIKKIEKVWKNWNGHMKIYGELSNKKANIMFRSKWNDIETIKEKEISVIGKIKKSLFDNQYYIHGIRILD